jgi:DNA-binding CsgD family transcriptional regulator
MSAVSLALLESPSAVDDVAGGIGDREAEVYRYAVRLGEITSPERTAADLGLSTVDVFAAVSRLVELHLLRTDGLTGRYRPMDPEMAASLLISPIERAIYQRRELADRLRDRIDAITRPTVEASEPVGAIDSLEGVAEIRGLFKLAAEVCRGEMAVLRPGHGDDELLDELLAPCYSVLERPVSVRVVCPHHSRVDFASRAKAKRLIAEGADVRTLSQVPQAVVVFDRSLAVMFSFDGPDGLPVARRVRDGAVVRVLLDMFEQLWDNASPFAAEDTGYAETIDDLQDSIARLMAQGLTDEVVARRLGMSVRTCRRHIAALLQSLDAVSRFQAGVLAAARLARTV